MAFQSNNLSVLAYANGFTLWHYTTEDPKADVDTTGYFAEAAEMLRGGDLILANLKVGANQSAGIFLVNTRPDNAVDVSDITPIGGSNTD